MSTEITREISVKVRAGSIRFEDYNVLKAQAQELADRIRGTVVTEDNVKETKKELAKLNKAVEMLESKRIEIKKKVLEQYNDFEAQVKEIVGIVKEADGLVRSQVRELEEIERENKREQIGQIWDARLPHYELTGTVFEFDDFLTPQHLNKSTTMKSVEEGLTAWLEQRERDLATIGYMDNADELRVEYKNTRDLSSAIQIVKRRNEEKQRLEEAVQAVAPDPTFGTPKQKLYVFIVKNEKDAKLTEMLLRENKIEFEKEIR